METVGDSRFCWTTTWLALSEVGQDTCYEHTPDIFIAEQSP